jgi:hypothetical protein
VQSYRCRNLDIEQTMNRRGGAEIPPFPLFPPFPIYKKWIDESPEREKRLCPTTMYTLLFILFFGGMRGKRGKQAAAT